MEQSVLAVFSSLRQAPIAVETSVAEVRSDLDDMMAKLYSGEGGNLEQIRRDQVTIAEQLDTVHAELLLKVDRVSDSKATVL